MKEICFFLLIFLYFTGSAQQQKYDFRLLRQDDPITKPEQENRNLYSRIKYVDLGGPRFLSFGASFRAQYEYFKNEEFSFSPNKEDGWFLQRWLWHARFNVNDRLSVFGEMGSSLISGKEMLAPVDRDRLYLNQLLLRYQWQNFTFLIGRENLMLGSRRLIDLREGPNVRRGFDQVSVEWLNGQTGIRLFAGVPVIPEQGVFDNHFLHGDELLFGLYADKVINGDLAVDFYYHGTYYRSNTYASGEGREFRHSLGGRIWKSRGTWTFDNEAVLQFGSFDEQNILAWTISFNIINQLDSRNAIGLKTELISGNTSDNRLGTFNPLYPRGAYFGRVARFGPANLIDFHPSWSHRMGKFSSVVDYVLFWKYSRTDDVYGPAMNIVLSGQSDKRFIGQQLGLILTYEFNTFAMVELETNFIVPGSYMKDVISDPDNLFHLVLTTELRL